MNTHSVELAKYNLKDLSIISFDSSIVEGSFGWEVTKEDSHHISGTLIWEGQSPKQYNNITLALKNIEEIPERLFTWSKSEIQGGKK